MRTPLTTSGRTVRMWSMDITKELQLLGQEAAILRSAEGASVAARKPVKRRVARLVKSKKVTVQQIADACGVSRTTVYNWLGGKTGGAK